MFSNSDGFAFSWIPTPAQPYAPMESLLCTCQVAALLANVETAIQQGHRCLAPADLLLGAGSCSISVATRGFYKLAMTNRMVKSCDNKHTFKVNNVCSHLGWKSPWGVYPKYFSNALRDTWLLLKRSMQVNLSEM